jgi:hypothetical protein
VRLREKEAYDATVNASREARDSQKLMDSAASQMSSVTVSLADLERRESVARDKEALFETREREASRIQFAHAAQERSIHRANAVVAAREAAVDHKSEEVDRRELDLEVRERELITLETAARTRETEICTREVSIARRESEQDAAQTRVGGLRDTVNDRLRALQISEEKLVDAQSRIAALEAELTSQVEQHR